MKKYITKQSSIKGAGKGLFTNASFKKGEVIGLAHVDDQPASEIGRNHNHNEKNPTAYSKKIDNKRFIYASRNLNPGEEITTNYRMQPELEQPEDFMRKGGSVLKMPNKKNSKGYSRSLSATNKLFTQNFLFAKPKSRKNKVFDPNSKYYAEGGEPCPGGKQIYPKYKTFGCISLSQYNNLIEQTKANEIKQTLYKKTLLNDQSALKASINDPELYKKRYAEYQTKYPGQSSVCPNGKCPVDDLVLEPEVENLPILKPDLIKQEDSELQGFDADAYNEALENLEAPSYEPVESYNEHFGRTGSLKHKYDIFIPNKLFKMDVGPGGIRYGKNYPIPKFGMKASTMKDPITGKTVNKQFRKDRKIQRETGLNRAYYEGSYDEEGNDIPGELENAETEGRRINFKGQYGRKDKKAQEQYNLKYDEYEFRKKFPTLLDKLNITYEDYIKKYVPKKQYGGPTSPEEWGQQIKDIEGQIGNPSGWTLSDYNALQNKLNEYKSWRENTPEGQAVIDTHNEEREYDIPLPEHLQDYTNAMMKARLAYANEFGNPAAERMINLPDNPYQFDNGDTGTHYMASMDNYAVPQIQDENGVLQLGDYGPESNEAIRFNSDEDANYFAENYKDVSPGFIEADLNEDEIEEYRRGGYIVEEIDNYQDGGVYTVKGSKGNYKKVNGKWQVDWNKSGKYQPLSKGDIKARTAILDKMAKPIDDGMSKVSSNSSDNTKVNYQKPLVESFNRSNNLESFYKKEREKDLQNQKDATAYHDKTQKVKQNQSFSEFINEDVLGIPTTGKKIDQFINQQYNRPIASAENNWNDGPIQMVYPEKYVIGPGGGLAGLGMKASKAAFAFKPISYLPSVGKALTYHSVYDAGTEHIPNTVKLLSDKSEWNNNKSLDLFKNLFKITSTAAGFSKYDQLKYFNRARNVGQFIDKATDANKDALKGTKMLKNFITTFKKYGGQQF